MDSTNIDIKLITEFIDKGVRDAQAAFGKFDKTINKLGKGIAGVFAVGQIVKFSKSSVAAYLADDKAANQLTQTLSNMGLAINSIQVENFIQGLQRTTGVLDDQLRPAMASLVKATNSVTQSQNLLQTSLDITASTGYDLNTVVNAFSRAALGNTTALAKLNLGLTSAEYKTKSFYDIQLKLSQMYAGNAAKAADTYAGKLAKLKVAFSDMQESIGKGLVDAFTTLGGAGGSIDGATNAMRKFGAFAEIELGRAASAVRTVIDLLNKIPGTSLLEIVGQGWMNLFEQDYVKSFAKIQQENTKQLETYYKNLKAQQKLNQQYEKDRLKALREQNKQLAIKLALEKASAVLRNSSLIFNSEAIQLAAAAANKQTEEDYLRIQIKSEMLQLDQAIQAQDVEAAQTLATKLKLDMDRLNIMRMQNDTISMMKNPFESWVEYTARLLKYLQLIDDAVNNINKSTANKPPITPPPSPNPPSGNNPPPPSYYTDPATLVQAGLEAQNVQSILNDLNTFYANDLGIGMNPTTGASTNIVYVTVEGSVTSEKDLTDAIVEQIYVKQSVGTGITYNNRTAI